MQNKFLLWWKEIDRISFIFCITLIFVGIVLSLTGTTETSIKKGFDSTHYIQRHLIFAILLLTGKSLFNKNFLEFFFKSAFQLNEMGWTKLNKRWAYFFIFLALLNEIIWRTQTEIIWVNFKVWGILPLTFIFTALQLPLINKHKI